MSPCPYDHLHPSKDVFHPGTGVARSRSLLVFETKGQHLHVNDDTQYKRRVFAALEQIFNAGKVTIHDVSTKGMFRLVFDRKDFLEAQTALDSIS